MTDHQNKIVLVAAIAGPDQERMRKGACLMIGPAQWGGCSASTLATQVDSSRSRLSLTRERPRLKFIRTEVLISAYKVLRLPSIMSLISPSS